MFNYYIYRTYFNAKHSFNGDITKIHGHSFTVVTYIGMKDSKEDIPFFKLEAIISSFIDQYRGRYLNELPEFEGCGNTLETIGDYFYEKLRKQFMKWSYTSLIYLRIRYVCIRYLTGCCCRP